jgi:hypothetical protein
VPLNQWIRQVIAFEHPLSKALLALVYTIAPKANDLGTNGGLPLKSYSNVWQKENHEFWYLATEMLTAKQDLSKVQKPRSVLE